MEQQPQPDYWIMTNKELIHICKTLNITRWSGKRKKDLIAMIKAATTPPVVEEQNTITAVNPDFCAKCNMMCGLPSLPQEPEPEPEPYEMLDVLLLEHANLVSASLPKSPINEEDEQPQECSADQITPATDGPMVRLPVGMAAISLADMADIRFIEY